MSRFFGSRVRKQVLSQQGEFVCPHCKAWSTYAETRYQQVFHLFFVPLYTVEERMGYQCTDCENLFDESVFQDNLNQQETKWECPKCHQRWPATNVRCPICRIRPDTVVK